MQDRFKSHIVMGGPDWNSIEKSVNGYPEGKPKRDIVADDGQKITLGDTSVTIGFGLVIWPRSVAVLCRGFKLSTTPRD